jgi:hypothetical protein
MPNLRQPIQSALQVFQSQPLRKAALALLDTLGYPTNGKQVWAPMGSIFWLCGRAPTNCLPSPDWW